MKKILNLLCSFMLAMTSAWAGEVATFNLGTTNDISSPEGFFRSVGEKWNWNSKFTGGEYDGMSFSNGLKMESTTKIGFTTEAVSTVTIVQSTWSANTIKLDDVELAVADASEGIGCRIYTVKDVDAGDHVISRGSGESGLFYVKVELTFINDANWYIDFATGEYYIIDAESGLMMGAGHDWGTRGIVNEMGLDLTLTPYSESRTVTINSRISNGGNSHFLGTNLYMDSNEWGWALDYQGYGFYILEPNGGQYINIDANNNLVLSDTPREFIIVTKEGVMEERMEELKAATAEAPVDATFLLIAPNFNRNDQRNAEAWIVSEDCTNKNLSGGNNVNNCAESLHSTFTIMQTISGAPAGFYQLTAQGFYRQDDYEGETPAAPVFFANEVNGDVPAKAGEENSMSAASESFTNGLYTIEPITFEVKEDGMMYVGITASTNTQWVIWDNFQLTYYGADFFAEDKKSPILLETYPRNGATDIPTSGNIVLTFNESIKISEQFAVSFNGKELIPIVKDNTITFEYSGLDYNKNYTFVLSANSVMDLSGNYLNKDISISFTTKTDSEENPTQVITSTIYVKAEAAPYLYSWYNDLDGQIVQPLGYWPGALMTETEEVQGETFWKMNISRPDDVTSFNIIFNNGRGEQTEDIIGLSSDRYYTYNGYSEYTDISEYYEKVPNAEISQVEIQGNFNGYLEESALIEKEDEYGHHVYHVYSMALDLSNVSGNRSFYFIINSSIHTDITSKLIIDAPDGWIEKQDKYCVLHHDITDYKTYILNAIWEENIDAFEGWTLKVEGKDYKYEKIDVQEWQMLATFYQSVGQGDGWVKKWDFTPSIPSVKTLPGVEAADGHVIGIDLSNNGLTGSFPFALLTLSNLKSLNLSDNQLTGDLGVTTYAFAQQNPTMMTHLQKLNISGNEFWGNIGLFANCFPSLTSLNASDNCFEDVFPVIPATVTTLDVSKQTISRVVPLHLAHLSTTDIATKVPTILFYDHANQTFTTNINLLCTTQYDSWGMAMSYQNGNLSIPYVSEQNTYYGESGDTLNVAVLYNNGSREGSTFRIKLSFDEGDGNFDGKVDVLDLQTNIMYIMEKYQTRPYNFTAANLWKDEQINIQDIICFVNFLMSMQTNGSEELSGARNSAPIASHNNDAIIYVENGELIVSTSQPVAAFDIFVEGLNETDFQSELGLQGFTFVVKEVNTGIRIIGYSLSGNVLPIGDNAIANLTASSPTVRYVMLADSEANAINASYGNSLTDIIEIDNSITPDSGYYDLQGRRANNPSSQARKGLYIHKGRKIFK